MDSVIMADSHSSQWDIWNSGTTKKTPKAKTKHSSKTYQEIQSLYKKKNMNILNTSKTSSEIQAACNSTYTYLGKKT